MYNILCNWNDRCVGDRSNSKNDGHSVFFKKGGQPLTSSPYTKGRLSFLSFCVNEHPRDWCLAALQYGTTFFNRCGLLCFLLFSFITPVQAADEHEDSSTVFSRTTLNKHDEKRAKYWDLDPSEWQRYQSIMRGPRGLWTPNLDPLQVLGLNAKTPSERKKYARKMAKMEFDRLTREAAFDKAFHQAYSGLVGDRPFFPVSAEKSEEKQTAFRYQYYIKLPCSRCQGQIKNWLNQSVSFDLYFLDSNNNDIKRFATIAGIPPLFVQSRRITLNHVTKTRLQDLGIKTLPAIKGGDQ